MPRPRPRKKARVHYIPQDETISVTRVSSSSNRQMVTQAVLLAPLQDNDANTAKTRAIPPATVNKVASAGKTVDPQAKQRYVSSVSPFQFRSLSESGRCVCFCVYCYFGFCFRISPRFTTKHTPCRIILLPNGFMTVTTFSTNFIGDVVGVEVLTLINVLPVCRVAALRVFDVWSACSPQQCACIA